MTDHTRAYSTTDPATLATYRNLTAQQDAFAVRLRTALDALPAARAAGYVGTYEGVDAITQLVQAGNHVPAGWIARNGKLRPAFGAEGKPARQWLAAHQPPDVRAAVAAHGAPRRTWAHDTERIVQVDLFEHDGAVWAVYDIEPGGPQDMHATPCTWTPRTHTDLEAARRTTVGV